MRRLLTWAAILLLATTGVAAAQENTTGSISGTVVDSTRAVLPRVTVSVTSDRGVQTYVTGANGKFLAPFLTPGAYTLRLERPGFRSVEQGGVAVRLGSRVELGFMLSVGSVAEVVQVIATAPVVDITSPEVGGTIDTDMLAQIPAGRQLGDALYLAPGVSSGGLTGSSNPSIAGGAGLDNQYYIDGVNVSDNGFGSLGVYSRSYRGLGQGVTTEFIDEIQVKTGGYEAEFGQSTGGLVNVITKSGSNLVSGSVFGFFQGKGLETGRDGFADWTNGRSDVAYEQRSDLGVTMGGPVLRDKVFFFGAFNPQWNSRAYNAPAGFPLVSEGDSERTYRYLSYAAKGTFQMASSHRLDLSVFGDPTVSDFGPQDNFGADLLQQSTSGFSRLEFGGEQQVFRYSGVVNAHFLLEASFARAAADFTELPSVDEWAVTDRRVTPNVRTGGIGFYEDTVSENLQYQMKATNLLTAGGTSHELRYGFQYEDISYDALTQLTGPTFTLPDGTPTVTGGSVRIQSDPAFGAIWRVARAAIDNGRRTTQKYASFFLQDSITVGDQLTISAGLRYDQQELEGNSLAFTWSNNWAPRIGVVFDPLGDGRSKIYGNYGTYFAKIPNDLAARAMGADAGITRADYFDAGLTMPVPDGVTALGATTHLVRAGTSPADFDPDSKSSYLSEGLFGFELEAAERLNLGVRYIWRDLGRVLEDVGTVALVLYEGTCSICNISLASVEYVITNINESVATVGGIGAFETPERNYQAVEVTADRRFNGDFSLFASYRYSRLYGNFEGNFRSDNGQSAPGITTLFDFPTNDPTYSSVGGPEFGYRGDIRFLGALGAGRLPNDREHQVKLFGNCLVGDLNIGMGLTLGSGRPLTELNSNPIYNSAGEIPTGPRGSGITTASGSKSNGDFENSVDLHLDYRLPIGVSGPSVSLIADMFNILNNQAVNRYNEYTELNFGVVDPDYSLAREYNNPYRLRIGARVAF